MQIDRLAAVIRPRTAWEGVDLGFALGRRWFPVLWGLWWLSALPAAALAGVWLRESPDLWILLLWWLKPVYEAPMLFWLSRALFGEGLGPAELWRHRREALPTRLAPYLLWRRFTLSRSFQLPLVLLEGLSGARLRERRRSLGGSGGTAAWLTVICVHLETLLWISALVLALILVPQGLPQLDLQALLFEPGSAPYWVGAGLSLVAMSVMAPFYVAAGFSVYLNRRTELEAWDLELTFRQLAAGEEGRPPPGGLETRRRMQGGGHAPG